MNTYINSFSRLLGYVAGIALLGMMLLTCADVLLRYLGHPILGCYEIVMFLASAAVGFAIAYTQTERGHIAVEFFIERLSKRIRTAIAIVNLCICIGMYSILAWQLFMHGTKLWRIGRVSETLEISYFPFVYGIAFGCAVMCIVLVTDLRQILKTVVNTKNSYEAKSQ
jgi:TRAP-type C4-dicarboxylate transport system permease small subunit